MILVVKLILFHLSKNLSEETKKELKCDTITELHKEVKSRFNSTKKTQKLKLSQDNSILSKKFKKIESEHAKSVREHEKKRKERMEIYKKQEKREMKRKFKRLTDYRQFYEMLKNMNDFQKGKVVAIQLKMKGLSSVG